MHYDFVAIGDITTDAFIKLTEAEEVTNHGTRELCIPFAGKVPFEDSIETRAVGNAANAAVAVRRLGLSAGLVTRVGQDDNGTRCLETLRAHGITDEYIERQPFATNYHYILMFGAERTILVRHAPFTYTLPAQWEPPRYLYFTSVSASAKEFHHDVARFCANHPETTLVFQPGTFQIKLGASELADLYAATRIFFCNKEEAQTILGTDERDVKKLMEAMRALGPRIVVITDGPNGSNILDDSGAWHVPTYPDPAPPVSRTGAGDATSATTVAYIMKGLEPKEALLRGAINGASVVQGIGAQTKLLTADDIDQWYARRPAEFVASAL